jgi:DNA-binding MarR family transcriptional regulator
MVLVGEELTELEMAAWRPFIMTATRVIAALDADMKKHFDISHFDHGLLVVLEDQPAQQARMGDIARVMRVDPSNVTYRVRRLEGLGLVKRAPCATDRRVTYARLTRRGKRLLGEAWPVHRRGIRRYFLDHVAPDQLREIADAFNRIMEADPTLTPATQL